MKESKQTKKKETIDYSKGMNLEEWESSLNERKIALDEMQEDLDKRNAELSAATMAYMADCKAFEAKMNEQIAAEKEKAIPEEENTTSDSSRESSVGEVAEEVEQQADTIEPKEDNEITLPKDATLNEEVNTTPSTPPVSIDLELVNPTMDNIDSIPPAEINIDTVIEPKHYQLPNGMAGKQYDVELSQLNLEEDIIVEDILGLEEFGLEYIKSESAIRGIPTEEGEMTFQLKYSWADLNHETDLPERQVRLLVNPDPKTLWQNKQPPADDLYFKNNTAADQLTYQDCHIVAASKRGRSHAHEGTFRDDHFLIEKLDNDWLYMAVADGAGSAEYSREGSRIACAKNKEVVAKLLLEKGAALGALIESYSTDREKTETHHAIKTDLYQIIGQGIVAARNAIIEQAKASNHEVRDYSTTLIFALVKKFDFGYFIASYAVGDGAVAIHKKEDYVITLLDPDGGEFAGQTRFIVMSEIIESDDIWKRIRFELTDDFSTLVLMTDGVSDPVFETDTNLLKVALWDKMHADISKTVTFGSPNCGEQLVEWLDFWSPGNHDDRTIAILARED